MNNMIEIWLRTPFAKALGWTLFHFLWQATLIALLLAAALFFFRPISARLRYGLACGAMLAMAIVFGATFVASLPGDGAVTTSPGSSSLLTWPIITNGFQPDGVPLSFGDRLSLAVPFWTAGVFVFYLHSLWSWMVAQRLRRAGICSAPAWWQERLHQLAVRLEVSRPVVLLESCLTDVPVVIGHMRPIILMPVGLLTGLRPEQLESILIHELAHIRRYDYVVNLLQRFVEGLLFYHPAVWWVSKLVRTERENCCDDVVVAVSEDAHGYAVTLATLEQDRTMMRQSALAASGGSLVKRIRRLLKQPEGPRVTAAPIFSASLLLVFFGVALAAWQPKSLPIPVAQPIAQAQPSPAPAQESTAYAYRKWLQEDVVYIIKNAERTAFNALKTKEEREKFIEQFWLVRDPTPGTPENEFKQEHYRRIAYANSRFGAGIPGWKTDRGHVYVVYGPPDEIESHPSGSTTSAPFEIWSYRHIEGNGDNMKFTFTDPTGNGEYRLMRSPRSNVSVEVSPDRTVAISIPVNADAKPVNIRGRVRSQAGKIAWVFEDSVVHQSNYRKQIGPVPPGSYAVEVSTQVVDGSGATESVLDFVVK